MNDTEIVSQRISSLLLGLPRRAAPLDYVFFPNFTITDSSDSFQHLSPVFILFLCSLLLSLLQGYV